MGIIVEKRDGVSRVAFDSNRIRNAVMKANEQVGEEDRASEAEIDLIVDEVIEKFGGLGYASVEEIQDVVEENLLSMKRKVGIKYHDFRRARAKTRNAAKESILQLVGGANKDVMEENSNKKATVASTQRDLIAGEVSKDITMSDILPTKIAKAHKEGVIHFHDMDYFIQPMFNCCLVNIKDMLDNGTVMNGKMIESPKSFQVACTVTTQIIASVASNQYGGQSVNVKHLAKYIRVSEEKYRKRFEALGMTGETLEKLVEAELKAEISAGIQTMQYQINTLMTTNGQTPFVTLFLELEEGSEYEVEQAKLIEEILKQRLEGIKNNKGVYVTPAFPKLIYVLDEHNCLKGGKYDYLTKLAVKCSAKRMYPDYISAKKMRENHEGEVFSCMGCRSFLSEWKDEDGNYKWEGRFNQGVVSINLPQIAILSQTEEGADELRFWQLLDERLAICFEALMLRHKRLLGTKSDVSPIHWQDGAIARLKPGEVIDPLLKDGYSTISLGYIGIYETTKLMTGESNTTEKGRAFALKVMKYLRDTCDRWKSVTGLGFGLYGTPAESLCYRFARIDKKRFGEIKDVTDKGYYTNSYHVDVREPIDAFAKLQYEAEFQKISSGGAISYIEIPNMSKNLDALEAVVSYIYDNIQYAEVNTKSDYCQECGYDGEIIINDDNEWECPCCGNKNHETMNVVRRTCGYLGENFWNVGKTKEIKARVTHL